MVRMIDADARRRLLAASVWTLMRNGGLEAASVRAVAAEAGLAVGSVRHFFATQDDLHVFAMQDLQRTITADVQLVLAEHDIAGQQERGTPARARETVIAVLETLLPLTPERAALFLAHLQFVAKAPVHPVLRPVADETMSELQSLYDQLIQHLVTHDAASSAIDVDAVASDLGILMDGLVWRRLTTPALLTSDATRAAMTGFIEGLSGGSR